jgi:hypothetical protein
MSKELRADHQVVQPQQLPLGCASPLSELIQVDRFASLLRFVGLSV